MIGRSLDPTRLRRCSDIRATRAAKHPEKHLADPITEILQADAYSGYANLYRGDRPGGPILEAACWAHARRPFFQLADLEAAARRKAGGKLDAPLSPVALAVVDKIDALFAVEREINGRPPAERLKVRQERSQPYRP